jgi:arabinose-5-phosphate isomerase
MLFSSFKRSIFQDTTLKMYCRNISTNTIVSIKQDLISLQQLVDMYEKNPVLQKNVKDVAQLIIDAPSVKVTGIGKSGYVGRRMAATLASVGVGSQFIHGTEWFHGDLGSIRENDLVFGITHSGGTFELLELAPLVKERGGLFCSMVGIENSPLTKLSDQHILTPVTNEILDKIPSRSIISQEVLINAIAYNVVKLTNFEKSDFLFNHPGGSIGKQK